MPEQNYPSATDSQSTASREELEQHLRARAWKDDSFRQEFVSNPKAVLERDYAQYFPEGQIPSHLSIKVIEEEEQAICFILPSKFSQDQLENINDEELLGAVSGGKDTKVFQCSIVTKNANCNTRGGGCRALGGVTESLKRVRL